MRKVKYYPPESRDYFQDNLQCIYCGNSMAFFIDLRLKHQVVIRSDSSIQVEFSNSTKKVFNAIAGNIDNLLYNDNRPIHCANCKNEEVDLQERLLDYCWQVGCPGCDVCGNYISQEELVDSCSECIKENDGNIIEDDCYYKCKYFDDGLENVRQYYGISLDEIKRDLGFIP